MRFCEIKFFDPHDLSLSTSTKGKPRAQRYTGLAMCSPYLKLNEKKQTSGAENKLTGDVRPRFEEQRWSARSGDGKST